MPFGYAAEALDFKQLQVTDPGNQLESIATKEYVDDAVDYVLPDNNGVVIKGPADLTTDGDLLYTSNSLHVQGLTIDESLLCDTVEINMNNHKIRNLTQAPTVAGNIARKADADLKLQNPITADLDFNFNKILNLGAPVLASSAARRAETKTTSYNTVVAASGGDYTTIGAAVAAGASNIFVRSGTYIESAITLPASMSKLKIFGENRTRVIISFGGVASANLAIGAPAGSTFTAGTIAVTQGSTAVTGSGTAWTALDGNQYITIQGSTKPYQIASINSATSLTLARAYYGPTQSGRTYAIRPYRTMVSIENCTITGLNAAAAITCTNALQFQMKDVFLNSHVSLTQCPQILINDCVFRQLATAPLTAALLGCTTCGGTIKNSVFSGSLGEGILLTTCQNISISGCRAHSNAAQGIHSVTSSKVYIDGTTVQNNNNFGIHTETTTSDVTINSSLFKKNGPVTANARQGAFLTQTANIRITDSRFSYHSENLTSASVAVSLGTVNNYTIFDRCMFLYNNQNINQTFVASQQIPLQMIVSRNFFQGVATATMFRIVFIDATTTVGFGTRMNRNRIVLLTSGSNVDVTTHLRINSEGFSMSLYNYYQHSFTTGGTSNFVPLNGPNNSAINCRNYGTFYPAINFSNNSIGNFNVASGGIIASSGTCVGNAMVPVNTGGSNQSNNLVQIGTFQDNYFEYVAIVFAAHVRTISGARTQFNINTSAPGSLTCVGLFADCTGQNNELFNFMQNTSQVCQVLMYGMRAKRPALTSGTFGINMQSNVFNSPTQTYFFFLLFTANYVENNAASTNSPFTYAQLESNGSLSVRTVVFSCYITGKTPGINFTDGTFTRKTVTNNFSS
jgi:hypothetical protein